MEQAIRSGGLLGGERFMSNKPEAITHAEDDLGFAAALPLAITAGSGLWVAMFWSFFRFVI